MLKFACHIAAAAFVSTFLAPPLAAQQESIIEHMAQLHSGPDEYYFFEDDRKQVVEYARERVVRICAGESQHLVPLKVTFDDRTAEVAAGDCLRVEAKSVSLEPTEPLDPNWMIRAEVDTLN